MATINLTVNTNNCTASTTSGEISDAQDLYITFTASADHYFSEISSVIGLTSVGTYIISNNLKKIELTVPHDELTGNITVTANANITNIQECLLNPNDDGSLDENKILLPLGIPRKDRIIHFSTNSVVVDADSPDFVEYNETLYYKKKSSLGAYSYEEVGAGHIEPLNIVQDLTTNTVTELDATAWSNLKAAHMAIVSNPVMTGLDDDYEFVKIKFIINSNNEYVKLIRNTTNRYSGLFYIEDGAHVYEIGVFYNPTSSSKMILRCATVV